MIRVATPDDSAAIIALVVAARMFPENDTEILERMLKDYFERNINNGHGCIIDEEEDKAIAVAYYEPALATDRTWYLTMIGVQPDYQRQGRGKALLQYVENRLQASGQRMLVIETSGLPDYQYARIFYAKCGYEQEARIRGFWGTGDDKIVFRKVLNLGVTH
ncbi:GCN5-related N-acetyltransferase [Gloeothece citriformis PCC 7424]|uniref:GCN5-related N-acetyltransferase n=1 Tax=Gloeothece citriformis (strain PCC 7424) TaxID=65393 RepID=B7KL22_GLOC7|nr:GNAT family N-acetyltransferase [Gloeothece citriformis]ACK72394.1 GCN5-related N-acetyltransferase [Gloeothece citriformis PCC 7424]